MPTNARAYVQAEPHDRAASLESDDGAPAVAANVHDLVRSSTNESTDHGDAVLPATIQQRHSEQLQSVLVDKSRRAVRIGRSTVAVVLQLDA